MSNASPRHPIGMTLAGRYRIQRRLGAGSCGTVFLVDDAASERKGPVALKVFKSEHVLGERLEGIQAEFRAIASLSHARIATAYDFGYLEGTRVRYYTREYRSGESLRPGPPRGDAPETTLWPVLRLLEALSFIHQHGHVHGDIHAGNLIVSDDPARGSVLLDDRARDNWEPLLAIAGVAGGEWPERARTVALGMSTGRDESEDAGGVALLHDLREVFHARSVDRTATQDILDALRNLDKRPWPSYGRGAGGLNAKQLRGLLRPFGVRSRNLRLDGGRIAKGYVLDDLAGAFSRYLPRLAATAGARESLPLQALQRDARGTCDGSHALQWVPCSGSRTHASVEAGGM